MKRATKITTTLLVVLALMACVFAFVACNENVETGTKSVTITIGNEVITAETDALYLSDLLTELKTNGKLSVYTTSGEGEFLYVTSIGKLVPGESQYVSIYHTIDDVTLKGSDYNTGAVEKTFGNSIYYYSGVGVSSLPVKDNASYLFALEGF